MTDLKRPVIFDGHNDVLLKLWAMDSDARQGFVAGYDGMIDVPKARAGGFGGGFFAIYVKDRGGPGFDYDDLRKPRYDVAMSPQVAFADALPVALAQAAILLRLDRDGALKICTTAADLRACLASDRMAAVMHMEGAEAIDPEFDALNVLYAAGLRSLGPVWSRPTIFGEGVPFAYPSDGDHGGGLTDDGKRLVAECNRLGVMIDLSHLNAAGFWDVARLSDAPLVATHSNAHGICPHSRNLTDRQLDAIRDSGGMVGVNFATAFLRPDGQMIADTPLEVMVDHLEYLIDRVGEDHVGFGSDFDGAVVPTGIADCAGLPALRAAMRGRGFGDALMVKLCHDNWIAVLEKTWGA